VRECKPAEKWYQNAGVIGTLLGTLIGGVLGIGGSMMTANYQSTENATQRGFDADQSARQRQQNLM
jgi:hypothetical protein